MSLKDTCVCASEALPITISSGSSLTSTINLAGLRLFSIVMPSSWTAANLTFQMSPDGGTTWVNMRDQNGNEIVAVADVSYGIILNPTQFSSVQYLRIRSGTAASPVAQSADRSLQLILRMV